MNVITPYQPCSLSVETTTTSIEFLIYLLLIMIVFSVKPFRDNLRQAIVFFWMLIRRRDQLQFLQNQVLQLQRQSNDLKAQVQAVEVEKTEIATCIEFLNKVPKYLWIMRQPYTEKSRISVKDVGRMVEMYLLTPEEECDREYGEYWIKWLLNASEEDLTIVIENILKREDRILICFPGVCCTTNLDICRRGRVEWRRMQEELQRKILQLPYADKSYIQRVQRVLDKKLME